MSAEQASQELLAQTMQSAGQSLKLYGDLQNGFGGTIDYFPRLHNGIPLAEEDATIREYVYGVTAQDFYELATSSAQKLGIAPEHGLVEVTYMPQHYDYVPEPGQELRALQGAKLEVITFTPAQFGIVNEHIISHMPADNLYQTDIKRGRGGGSTHFDERPTSQAVISQEACTAIGCLLMSLPLLQKY